MGLEGEERSVGGWSPEPEISVYEERQIFDCYSNIWLLYKYLDAHGDHMIVISWKTLHPSEEMEGRGGNEVGEHGLVDCSSAGGCFETGTCL